LAPVAAVNALTRTIVCVDDDDRVLAAIVRCLRALPVEILWTTDPHEAVELVRTRDIAVVLSDFEMPELSGIELAAAVRQIRMETVRVLLTGRHSMETAIEGINRGEVFRYISKPVDSRTLRLVIGEALEHHETLIAPGAALSATNRKDQLERELDAEYPGLTTVVRTPNGIYVVSEPPSSDLVGELAALEQLGRQK
jgi:DNA-binding NtrC family response regulator